MPSVTSVTRGCCIGIVLSVSVGVALSCGGVKEAERYGQREGVDSGSDAASRPDAWISASHFSLDSQTSQLQSGLSSADAHVSAGRSDATVDSSLEGQSLHSLCGGSPPVVGAHCSPEGIECEYGADPQVACDILAECVGSAWAVLQTPSSTGCETTNPPRCPATYSAVLSESSCPTDEDCYYAEARCYCGCGGELFSLCSSDSGMPALYWGCDAPPVGTSECPVPRPRIGSPCDHGSPGPACSYAACAGGVALVCADYRWQVGQPSCPP